MAKIIIDKTSFIYEDSRRIRIELVNVADYYNNFTAAPLNTLDEIDGKLDMHLVLAEMLAPIYSQHNNNVNCYIFNNCNNCRNSNISKK